MREEEFLIHLADAMQCDTPLSKDTRLADLEEWDSLAVVSLLALYDSLFKIELSGNAIKSCECVSDLLALAKDRLE